GAFLVEAPARAARPRGGCRQRAAPGCDGIRRMSPGDRLTGIAHARASHRPGRTAAVIRRRETIALPSCRLLAEDQVLISRQASVVAGSSGSVDLAANTCDHTALVLIDCAERHPQSQRHILRRFPLHGGPPECLPDRLRACCLNALDGPTEQMAP